MALTSVPEVIYFLYKKTFRAGELQSLHFNNQMYIKTKKIILFSKHTVMRKIRETILILIFLLMSTNSINVTSNHGKLRKNQHKMAHYWWMQIIFSPIGIGFNSFVLYLFVVERKNLVKSVNVMLG